MVFILCGQMEANRLLLPSLTSLLQAVLPSLSSLLLYTVLCDISQNFVLRVPDLIQPLALLTLPFVPPSLLD